MRIKIHLLLYIIIIHRYWNRFGIYIYTVQMQYTHTHTQLDRNKCNAHNWFIYSLALYMKSIICTCECLQWKYIWYDSKISSFKWKFKPKYMKKIDRILHTFSPLNLIRTTEISYRRIRNRHIWCENEGIVTVLYINVLYKFSRILTDF